MTQKPVRGLRGQSRSQAANLILSGWQGSDEDEEVIIDSSDDEKVKRKSASSISSLIRPRTAEEDSGSLAARDTEALTIGGYRRISSPQFERSGPDPGGGSTMKVMSSDARRFRKELTANKSGAKMAVIPRESSDAPSMEESPGSERKDKRRDAPVEDGEEEDVSPGKSPDSGNKGCTAKESFRRSVGTGDKPDRRQLDCVTETRKRKARDSKETSVWDDEARKKRRYRELEQAQRIADRKLTLRERPEARQQDGGSRREASPKSNSGGRRLHMAFAPQEQDTKVRLRSGNEMVHLELEESWRTDKMQKLFKRKAKISENDSEIAEKVLEKRSTRSTEKIPGVNSPSKQAAGVSTKIIIVPITDSKDVDLAVGKDGKVESTTELGTVDVSGEPKDNLAKRSEGLSLLCAETVENATDNVRKSVSPEMDRFKPADLPISAGNGVDRVGELKKTRPVEKDTDLFCKESLYHTIEKALHDSVDVSEEVQPSGEDTISKAEKRASCPTGGDDSLKSTEFTEAYVAVNIDVGPKSEEEGREKSRRKIKSTADCTGLRVYEIEEAESHSESQVSGNIVEDRGLRCLHPLGEGAVDLSAEGAARAIVVGAKPDMNVTQKAGEHKKTSKGDSWGPDRERRLNNSSNEYHARREGSAACLLEQGADISLSDERRHRPMAGGVVLHDQTADTIAVCALTVEDADDDHSEEASEVDDHNSFCEACLLGGMLLCCDASGCKVTYHLECADPSMTEVPEGKWYCPSCAQKRLSFGVHASLKTVDSIWDVRDCTFPSCSGCRHGSSKSDTGEYSGIVHEIEDLLDLAVKDREGAPERVQDSPGSSTGISQRITRRKQMELEGRRQSEKQKTDAVTSSEEKSCVMLQSAEDVCKGCDRQYFVKWKNLSHVHNAWVSESELKKAAPKMLESFKKRLETETSNQVHTKWKPIWQVPQRFISKRLNAPPRRPGGGRGRGYLGMDAGLEWFVKWHDLGYEHCTWEQVQSGVLDCEVSRRLESSYDRWFESARRRSHPARIEEVMTLREAKYKLLDDKPDWLQQCKLSTHQLDELNGLRERWHHHRNTLMVDESDQERTTTAVAFLLSLIEEYGSFKPILVVVPVTGCQMWESELHRCAEHVNTVVYGGTLAGRSVIQRHELNPAEKPVKFQILLTTFDIAIIDHDHLEKFEWEAVILDEGHRSRLTKSYRHLQFVAPYRLILLNDFSKCIVWELLQFLVYLEPENHFLESELERQLEELDEDSQLTFLRGKLTAKMVGDGSSHGTTPLEFREHCIAGNMTPVQVHLYCSELTKHYNLLHNGRTRADQNLGSIYGLTGTLRNVCNHPFLVDPTLQDDLLSILKPSQSLVKAGIQQCGKFKTLQMMVTHLRAKGRRVLLLCQTDMLCYYFDDYMRQIFGADSYECVFKGSEAVKTQAIQRFNAEDSTRFVFILKRNTAGVSFQLRETDVVIVYDSDWNPANDIQYLEKVIYKVQGQLTIYRLYTRLSVEEAAIVYSRPRRLELQSGIKVLTVKYCQQIVKWKVKELFELYDTHSKGVSEKELMAEILGSSETPPDNTLKKILDGDGKGEAESFKEEMPEEDGEVLKEFWSSLLRDRYAALQIEELTNAGKGLRSRKRVHYSEDALALASYAAGNEEEVKKKRRKAQGSEVVQRGSPRANSLHSSFKSSPATLVDTSSADEVLPAKTVPKEVKNVDVTSHTTTEGTAVIVPENRTTGAELPSQVEEEGTEVQARVLQREEPVQPVTSKKVSTKSASGISSTTNEEGRKTRSEQQQIMLGLWRPDVSKICKTLGLSEKVATYADQLLVYCMKSYRMPKEPKDLVLQVQIALCVVAAERFHQEIDHLTTLSRVEEAMDVKLKRESWNDNYQKFVSCCKGYPLPELPDPKPSNQVQSVAVLSDTSRKSKSTDEDPSLQRAVAGSEVPKRGQPLQDVDKLPAFQIIECGSTENPVDDPKIPSDQGDQLPKTSEAHIQDVQRQAAENKKELDTQGLDAPPTLLAQIEDAAGRNETKVQGVVEDPVIEENLLSTVSKANKDQVLEKLKIERHEINSVVVYQQTKEMNEFFRSKKAEKEDLVKHNDKITADVMKTVTDPEQRVILLQGHLVTHREKMKRHDLGYKEQQEMLVKGQRAVRDEIHSVFSELLRQAEGGSSRSLYDEAQGILAKMGVKSVAEAQGILRTVGEEARRKKAPVGFPQGPVVRSQIGRTSAQSQAPRIGDLNSTGAIQHVSPTQPESEAGAQPQPSHAPQMSQPLPQTPELSGTQPAQPLRPSQPPLSQVQQAVPTSSQMSRSTHCRNSTQPVQPILSSVQANDVHHPLPPRPTMLPRQNYIPLVQENAESPHLQLPVSSNNVPVADSVSSQLLHNVGRTHILQPSVPSQQQRNIQARQLQTEQLRTLRRQIPPILHQQAGWHTSSSGQGPPAYTRLHPQPQQSSNSPSTAVSTVSSTHGVPSPTLNSVAQFPQAPVTFLPPIAPNMLGPDPVLQEEARLKKEKENIRAAYEKKASEIRKKFGEEVEDARRKYEAMVADLKRKFDGMLDENAQLCHRQTSVVHQNHVKAHRSRLLAEALRHRAMFDVVYQPRNIAHQSDEPGSASGQGRGVQSATGYIGNSGRSLVQRAQQNVSPMRVGNEGLINTGSGQFVNAASPAGRALLQPFHQSSSVHARILAASQREGSARSGHGVPCPAVAVPQAFPSGGLVLQHTHHSNLVPTEDVQGPQRNELAFAAVQPSNNQSPGGRPPVAPSGIGRVQAPALTSSFSGSSYPGSPNTFPSLGSRGPAGGTPVQSSGRGNEQGGALVGGLWQSCNPNSITRSGSWHHSVPRTSQACTTDTLPGCNTGEATWNRPATGSVSFSPSAPSIPSGGLVQPAFDGTHRQLLTSQNSVNGKLNPSTLYHRRSWMDNVTPPSTTNGVGSQSSIEGSSDNLVPVTSSRAATEGLPGPTLVASNEAILSGTPAIVSTNPPTSTVAMSEPVLDSSPRPTSSVTPWRGRDLGVGETLAGGLSEGLTDAPSEPPDTSRSDVPIIYLSDDD